MSLVRGISLGTNVLNNGDVSPYLVDADVVDTVDTDQFKGADVCNAKCSMPSPVRLGY